MRQRLLCTYTALCFAVLFQQSSAGTCQGQALCKTQLFPANISAKITVHLLNYTELQSFIDTLDGYLSLQWPDTAHPKQQMFTYVYCTVYCTVYSLYILSRLIGICTYRNGMLCYRYLQRTGLFKFIPLCVFTFSDLQMSGVDILSIFLNQSVKTSFRKTESIVQLWSLDITFFKGVWYKNLPFKKRCENIVIVLNRKEKITPIFHGTLPWKTGT